MIRTGMAIAALWVAGSAAAAAKPGEELGWLSGKWISESRGRWTEELWTEPRGGTVLGVNRSGRDDKMTGYEFMRIACARGECTLYASPSGKPAVAFKEISRLALPRRRVYQFAFENPAHDYPTRIVYRREGDRLVATVSGPKGKNPMRWTFRRR